MNPRLLMVVCVGGLIAAFAIDLLTPQLFIAAILLDIPIVLSAFAGNRRLTGSLVIAALVANAVAGYVNGIQAGSVWDAIAIGDRLLEALSIVLVGWLGLAVHRGAEQQGIANAMAEAVERERALREASENIRQSLSEELVERRIVNEARELLAAKEVAFYRSGRATEARQRMEIESVVTRAAESGEQFALSRSDAMGRLVIDAMDCESGIVAPLSDGRTSLGVLLVSLDRDVNEEDLRLIGAFRETAGIALQQARLFIELAKKNDELAQRSQIIRDLVYALSHDLRTPLAAAGLTLRQALDGAYGPMPERYREILQRSIEANDGLQRLAETLLLVAQYESGEQARAYRRVDISHLARDVAAQMQPLADSKALRIELDIAPASVNGDAGELRRALVNLFANAVQWSQEGGRIAIAVRAEDGIARVALSDEGLGVPENMRARLFTRFAGDQQHGAGTGLGLYIVRRIAESHGGRVRYEPSHPRGSIFSIELPALAGTPAVQLR